MSRECLQSLSPWFWISKNCFLEMKGVETTKSAYAKGGMHIKRMCAYEGEWVVKF